MAGALPRRAGYHRSGRLARSLLPRPPHHPLARTPPLRVGRGARIAVVGPNGAGKTTLVRTLIGELPALEGYVAAAPTARVAYLAQSQGDLASGTVLEALRDASGLAEQPA